MQCHTQLISLPVGAQSRMTVSCSTYLVETCGQFSYPFLVALLTFTSLYVQHVNHSHHQQHNTVITRPYTRGGGTGVLPRWLRDSPQYKQCYRGLVSGEAILSAENSAKPLGGRGSAPNPAGGPLGAPSDPVAGGRGLAAPPQELHPLSRRSALRSSPQ